MTSKRTTDLQPGDRVHVTDTGDIVRHVHHVADSGYVNARNAPLFTVHWVEGRTDEWSAGNTVNGTYEWTIDDAQAVTVVHPPRAGHTATIGRNSVTGDWDIACSCNWVEHGLGSRYSAETVADAHRAGDSY